MFILQYFKPPPGHKDLGLQGGCFGINWTDSSLVFYCIKRGIGCLSVAGDVLTQITWLNSHPFPSGFHQTILICMEASSMAVDSLCSSSWVEHALCKNFLTPVQLQVTVASFFSPPPFNFCFFCCKASVAEEEICSWCHIPMLLHRVTFCIQLSTVWKSRSPFPVKSYICCCWSHSTAGCIHR